MFSTGYISSLYQFNRCVKFRQKTNKHSRPIMFASFSVGYVGSRRNGKLMTFLMFTILNILTRMK